MLLGNTFVGYSLLSASYHYKKIIVTKIWDTMYYLQNCKIVIKLIPFQHLLHWVLFDVFQVNFK